MSRTLVELLEEMMAKAPEPDWNPAVKDICTCGHSWLFHWLKDPHKCNDCRTCAGYAPQSEARP